MMLYSDGDWFGTQNAGTVDGPYRPVARHEVVPRDGRQTLVVLHGYAGGATQTREFFQDWIECIDDSSFVFLEAATPCSGIGGFGWLPLTSDQRALSDHLQDLAPRVEQYVANVLSDEGLGSDVLLIGHSQGAMLALEMVARTRLEVEGAVAISGMYPLVDRIPPLDKRVRNEGPKIVFVHGCDDPMIPSSRARESEQAFRERGYRTHIAVVEGGQHALTRAYARQALHIVLAHRDARQN